MLPFSTFNVLFTNALLFSASSESNNALTICGGIYSCAGLSITPKGVNLHAEILTSWTALSRSMLSPH